MLCCRAMPTVSSVRCATVVADQSPTTPSGISQDLLHRDGERSMTLQRVSRFLRGSQSSLTPRPEQRCARSFQTSHGKSELCFRDIDCLHLSMTSGDHAIVNSSANAVRREGGRIWKSTSIPL